MGGSLKENFVQLNALRTLFIIGFPTQSANTTVAKVTFGGAPPAFPPPEICLCLCTHQILPLSYLISYIYAVADNN